MVRLQRRARLHEHLTWLHVIVLVHDVLARRYRPRDAHAAVAVFLAVFQHDHGVGPFGHLSARGNAHARTGRACARRRGPHLDFPRKLEQCGQRLGAPERIGRHDGEPVDRRAVERWHALDGHNVLRDGAAYHLGKRQNQAGGAIPIVGFSEPVLHERTGIFKRNDFEHQRTLTIIASANRAANTHTTTLNAIL